MDYQAFNSQQAPFGGFNVTSSAPSPQANLHPQAPFQQPNAQFAYGQYPTSNGMSMMQPMQLGGMQRELTRHGAAALQQQQSYSQPPFSQALPSPAHHQFAQGRQTASPSSSHAQQPYAPAHAQQSPGTLPSSAQQQQQHPMSQVKPEPAQAQTPVKAVPPSPVSPVAQARNQDRVATLLEINSILIKEVCDLQTQGKAGQVGQPADGKPEGDKPAPSKEYVDYMRRLQANLAFLAQNAEKNPKPGQQVQPGPAIMSIPAAPADLVKLYQKLVDLFPGWKGQTAQMKQSPGPQRINSTTSIGSQPPNSAGLQQNWGQSAMANMQQAQLQAKVDQ
ncbi:hypothetical protein CC86DRAFT_300092 [Ophiobolus disseminans]|uniref:Uncharacterized protein n=1 Tax=Ophiobolus disseminans TaxID=1469910 RepID=A0A6A6ZPK5_9PLEO|nr:hypothetical protein CC86DRAFT_300092 [Ophiobolus disseminans]